MLKGDDREQHNSKSDRWSGYHFCVLVNAFYFFPSLIFAACDRVMTFSPFGMSSCTQQTAVQTNSHHSQTRNPNEVHEVSVLQGSTLVQHQGPVNELQMSH